MSYKQLTHEERYQISVLLKAGLNQTEIAMLLKRHKSTINIFNGMLSLTFSCDGSHYMHYKEFLEKGVTFWSGLVA